MFNPGDKVKVVTAPAACEELLGLQGTVVDYDVYVRVMLPNVPTRFAQFHDLDNGIFFEEFELDRVDEVD